MARTQADNYTEIRQGILDRTADLFARQGYSNTSIADIAAANRTSRGLLYHYFKSKEAMLAEMLHGHLDYLLGELRRSNEGATPAARFRDATRVMVRINADSKALQIVLLHDLMNLNPVDQQAIIDKQRAVLSLFRPLIEACDGGKTQDAARLGAQTMMFMGMINYTYLWYDPDGPVGPTAYADMVVDTCLDGLKD